MVEMANKKWIYLQDLGGRMASLCLTFGARQLTGL